MGAWMVVPAAFGQALDAEPVRGLDQRFSEEIGVEEPAIFEPDTSLVFQSTPAPERSADTGFTAQWTLSREHVDNVFRTAGRGTGDNRTRLDTELGYKVEFGRQKGRIAYRGNIVAYDDLNDENTIDHEVEGQSDLQFTKRFGARLKGAYRSGHDERGDAGARLVQSVLPDLWTERSAGITLTYGRRIAKAQIEASAEHTARRFENNNQDDRDVDTWTFGLKGYYNFTPTFSAIVEASRELLDYRSPTSNLGGERWAAFTGVRWEATARTTGEAKVGLQKRRFDDGTLNDSVSRAWDVRVIWTPRPTSVVQVFTSQSDGEGSGAGATQTTRMWGTTLTHAFNRKWRSDSQLTLTDTTSGANREDEAITAETTLSYALDDGLALKARYRRAVRTSTQNAAGFKDNIYSVQLVANYPDLLGD